MAVPGGRTGLGTRGGITGSLWLLQPGNRRAWARRRPWSESRAGPCWSICSPCRSSATSATWWSWSAIVRTPCAGSCISEAHHRHVQPSAADQAVVPAVVVVQLETEQARGAGRKHRQGPAPDLGLHAAAADRALRLPAGMDQEHRPGGLRSGAAGVDDGAKRARAAGFETGQERLEQLQWLVHGSPDRSQKPEGRSAATERSVRTRACVF